MAPEHSSSVDPRQRRLWQLGVVTLALYVGLLAVSFAFRPDDQEPPILLAVTLLAAATGVYWAALYCVLRRAGGVSTLRMVPDDRLHPQGTHPRRSPLRIILGFAVAYRLLLLPSWPIQEIDFYRYLWDGRVTLAGFNPYHYSPAQIDNLGLPGPLVASEELSSLSTLSHRSVSLQTIFERVHHRDVPTAYPPVAQVAFALAAWITPAAAPIYVHVLLWKVVLAGFDLGTLLVLVALLRRLALPETWCLAYGWCPLALKEFSNSGHFDAVAAFFSTVTALGLVAVIRAVDGRRRDRLTLAGLSAVSLALAVLAKTYPVVLLPVVTALLIAHLRSLAVVPLALFASVVAVGYAPFVVPRPTPAMVRDSLEPHHPGAGLGTFLSQWEMNDLLFMLVRENLRPPLERPDRWFVVVPGAWRTALYADGLLPMAGAAGLSVKADPVLVLTQLLLGVTLVVLCLRWAWTVYRRPEPPVLLRAVFLSLAWGWLLSAAQNPWYLLWCLPFMVFAPRRSWFLLPGLVLLYYVRFWLEYHDTSGTLEVFDYGLVWLEYAPFLLALVVESWWPCRAATDEVRREDGTHPLSQGTGPSALQTT